MGQCNFCTFRDIRKRAKKRKLAITTYPFDGGVQLLVHPPDVTPVRETESPYFAAWFMELPARCACHT